MLPRAVRILVPGLQGPQGVPGTGGATLDTDGTLAANSDANVASQKATKTYADTKVAKAGGTMTGPLVVATTVAGGIATTGDGVASAQSVSSYAATQLGSSLNFAHYRGTLASPAALTQNDFLGDLTYQGATGASTKRTGMTLRGQVIAATPSETDFESRMLLFLNPPATVAQTEIWRFQHSTGFSMFGANSVVNQNRHFRKRQYAAASLPSQNSGDEIGSSDIVAAPLVSDGTDWLSPGTKRLRAVAANTTISIPAGWALARIHFAETAGNAVTGGIKIGTTSGATDVVAAQAVGASSLDSVTDANLLKRVFSRSAAQTLFIQAVSAWNSASVEISFVLRKVF